jgi:hypothetical protein
MVRIIITKLKIALIRINKPITAFKLILIIVDIKL